MINKQDVLNNLEQVKQYIQEAENKKEEKVIGLAIRNRFTGSIIFQSTKTTYKDAVNEFVAEANNKGNCANLTGANLTACTYYMGSSNKNFEALCKAIKTIKWNSNTGSDFIN